MGTSLRYTTRDLELLPDPLDDKRYEIINGELYVSKQPHLAHQFTCGEVFAALRQWSTQTGTGRAYFAPGVIFADDDNVAPDVVWVSKERLPAITGPDGKFHAAPDLVVEVLSPGITNEQRDREFKLALYSRRGVREYWIVAGQRRQVEIYRRENQALRLTTTLFSEDTLRSPLLPGFAYRVGDLFSSEV
ncbi:MAG: Uma2 family endonuclease [Chloroflexi bacterium]|nr:Uma2 family endonuclease [Chloroflexota bacterium]